MRFLVTPSFPRQDSERGDHTARGVPQREMAWVRESAVQYGFGTLADLGSLLVARCFLRIAMFESCDNRPCDTLILAEPTSDASITRPLSPRALDSALDTLRRAHRGSWTLDGCVSESSDSWLDSSESEA